jgi:hypothetical protein
LPALARTTRAQGWSVFPPASSMNAQATLVRHFKYAMTASMRERTWSF